MLGLRLFALCSLVLPLLVTGCTAGESPDEAVEAYLQAYQEEGAASLGRFYHPDDLQGLKDLLLEDFAPQDDPGAREFLEDLFGRDARLETVRLAEPREFIDALMGRVSSEPGASAFKLTSYEILDTVQEGELTNVRARMTHAVGDQEMSKVEVFFLRADGETWKLAVTDDIRKMVASYREQAREQAAIYARYGHLLPPTEGASPEPPQAP